jgi:sugar phosphate isomerase/epimerase
MTESTSSFPVTLALSAHWHTYPERFQWIPAQDFALEYSPNPKAFEDLPEHLDPILEADIPVRHHGFFPGYEIAHSDGERAEKAVQLHFAALDAMHGRGEQVITLHIGLKLDIPLDHGRAIENLARIAEYARQRGITVALENLRRGPTSHPDTLLHWASQAETMITLDVGHATSNQHVLNGELTAPDFVDAVADRLVEVHMYEKETDRHHAPHDMQVLGPIVDRLLHTSCSWWTIELNEYEDALSTRKLLHDYVEQTRRDTR